MPAEVPLADAVDNVGHAALLVLGLAQGDLSLIARGLADSLHQPRRRHLYPRSMELVEGAADIGRAGGDDLRRRTDRPVLVPLGADRRAWWSASALRRAARASSGLGSRSAERT